ncbi:hypothetical protein DVH29_16100, partial [Pelagibacterium lacus]
MGAQGLPTTILATVFLVSLGITALLVLTARHHLAFTSRHGDSNAVQAAHHRPTPRIGGVAIFGAICIGFVLWFGSISAHTLMLFAVSVIPVFVVGLFEDIGIHMRPRNRLLAAAASSVLAIALMGLHLPRLDLPGLDAALAIPAVAMLFTVFAATGVCHAMNLIDGLNGLAGSVAVIIAGALSAIAFTAGDPVMGVAALCILPALLGFLAFNFPRGTIFLGDAGAYSIGHVLAWLGIIIVWRNPDVSPWAVLLVFFWPVCDTLFAIYRRKRLGKPTDQPDRMHFHQIVMRFIEITFVGKNRRQFANPLATALILPMAGLPAFAAVLVWDDTALAALLVLVFAVLFIASYVGSVRFLRRSRAIFPYRR